MQFKIAELVFPSVFVREEFELNPTVLYLIMRLCINTGKQTDHSSTRAIAIVRLERRTIVDNSSRRMIRLLARIYTQTYYQTSDRPLPKLVRDGWSVSSINRTNENLSTEELAKPNPAWILVGEWATWVHFQEDDGGLWPNFCALIMDQHQWSPINDFIAKKLEWVIKWSADNFSSFKT